MKKIETKKILHVVALCILVIVPFLKFFSMNLEKFGVISEYDFINPATVLYVSIPFLVYIYIKDIISNKRKLDFCDYIFYALVFTSIISTIFSIDKSISIFGKCYRHEGLLSILSYYLLFINYKVNGTKKDKENFIKFLIILGIANSIYAILQIYTDFDFIIRHENDIYMASGLCGNPNFFGSLMVTIFGIVICHMMVNKNTNIKEVLTLILIFISIINSQSTGPFLTSIVTIVLASIFLYKNGQLIIKNLIMLIIILILTYTSVFVINKYALMIDRCEMCTESIEENIKNGGNGRLKIWENSFNVAKNNLIVGVGFDNLYLVYPNQKLPSGITITLTNSDLKQTNRVYRIVDNAHNVYLHNLVSTGIFGLISYLTLVLFTLFKGIKSKKYLILSGFVAYSIQAFFNISVIQVAPIYYILIGFILSDNE